MRALGEEPAGMHRSFEAVERDAASEAINFDLRASGSPDLALQFRSLGVKRLNSEMEPAAGIIPTWCFGSQIRPSGLGRPQRGGSSSSLRDRSSWAPTIPASARAR